MNYNDFLLSKATIDVPSGFDCDFIPEKLFDFQKAIVKWALKRGRAAVFADTGLGKTMIQTAWAHCVFQYTGNRVLIVAPLCVAQQTIREAEKLDISLIQYVTSMDQVTGGNTGVFITNYEHIDKFDFDSGYFDGIVLDESSILKHQDSKTRTKIISKAREVPYKLSCTATPSPNDYMELASQSEFLGIMDASEMLAMFFVHDSGETSKWRLKGHGKVKFWEWLSRWSVVIKRPSDLGFKNDGYDLPCLNIIEHIVTTDLNKDDFISKDKMSLGDRNKARRASLIHRVEKAAEIVNSSDDLFLVWCHLNDESKLLTERINNSLEVKGSDKVSVKEKNIMSFTDSECKALVTKPKIAGFGMNWQHCNNMIFVGLNDSYEQLYQAIRRCYRFGQSKDVNVHMVISDIEHDVLQNLKDKEKKAIEMQESMIKFMAGFQKRNVTQLVREKSEYVEKNHKSDNYELHLGDCVEVSKKLDDQSIDYSVFSPPFSSLYTYSNSDRDMGNSKDHDTFWGHFQFLIKELFRILRNGRNISVHCMNLPTSKTRHGFIGIYDFRGELIRAFQKEGFIYHSEVTVWKNPVVAMQRTKALGLLWKQIKKDSSMNRQGIPDYVVTFRKPGVNTKPISHDAEDFTVDEWQFLASPCWNDIKQSNTLNGRIARENEDERHIAPLQLDLIERCLRLWSMPGDTVFSPFAGIGSEGYVSLQMGRKFIGSELKNSYYELAKTRLDEAETSFGHMPRGNIHNLVKGSDSYKPIKTEQYDDPDMKNQLKMEVLDV